MECIKIPIALQLVMDDMGWHHGENGLSVDRPARTGINRDHEVEDYTVVNEVGKRLGMHVLCGFTIGEWDKDNVLRGMKHATWDEANWDRASEIDYEKAQSFFEAIENSEYIDIAFHGLMHGYWEDGRNYGSSRELFSRDHEAIKNGTCEKFPVKPVSAEYVEEHLRAWFEIYNSWGFTKKVESIILPASLYKEKAVPDSYAAVARKYGIKYWKNFWLEHPCLTELFNGIIFINAGGLIDWNCFDIDPLKDVHVPEYNEADYPEVYAVMGTHWANFVYSDPAENIKHVDEWVQVIKAQEKVFGRMLSKDMAFACHQAQYHAHTKMTFNGGILTLDVSDVVNSDAISKKNEFYVSIKDELRIKSVIGARVEVYQEQADFTTYKLSDFDTRIEIEFQ